MAETEYDLVVIGAGPGGYVAAIRAAQLGMKVACVDKRDALGGTCLNVGCIPSKALLQSSEKFAEAQHSLADHGVKIGKVGLDLGTMLARKDDVVDGLTKGIAFLFKKNKVDQITGTATIKAPDTVEVGDPASTTLKTKRILVATGSESMPLPGVEIDEKKIVTSTGALSLTKVPDHMVVIGGGYIGLEMGSVWGRLGADVTVVEFLDRIVPTMDSEVAVEMHKALEKQGMTFRLGTKVTGAKNSKSGVALTVEPAAGGDAETIDCSVVLSAIGRRPYTAGLGLEDVGVDMDNRGFIQVDKAFQTNVSGIFAIGDVIPGPMLAHKAEDEGVVAVEMMDGQAGHIDYNAIPAVVFTSPEVASVGRTEEQLKEDGVEYSAGKFPFMANSRARASEIEHDGFVKILADAKTDQVLGAHIIGPDAGTMIAELALAMEFSASAEDIARTCHAHPTLNEAVKEAALAAWNKPVHI
ncbi:MAG: dihydrolipoyl dehydrogenase [Rhodospirillaceae bacterium]|nr:dihydrolipoyl dehydrogenase [Rhodospirillaceae bacterium]|tara:strand:- start:26541 stop:27947 length:1407 start_codon:yes stop_codon:yes gene_type:complete